jgi:Lrp/AsnC family leucine-responsive transcriptional regulator
MPAPRPTLDDADRAILRELADNARRSSGSIASKVGLSASAVRRRITRLEKDGIIIKYTAVVDHDLVEPSLEAYLELSFPGSTDVNEFVTEVIKLPQVREASTIAGDPDAVLRLRVRDVDELREVVTWLRKRGQTTASKTLVALGRLRHQSGQHGSTTRTHA